MSVDPSTAHPGGTARPVGGTGSSPPRPVYASVTAGELETHYARAGRGSPALFVARVAQPFEWPEQSLACSMAATHRVTVAHPPDPAETQHGFASWLLGLLDGLGIVRTALVATGEHALHALHFALQHGERIERLALVGCDPVTIEGVVLGDVGDGTSADRVPLLILPGTLQHPNASDRNALALFLAGERVDGAG
ncbi:MAG: hypothetical protein ACLGIK_00805 [Gemmatimonadota bacterium]